MSDSIFQNKNELNILPGLQLIRESGIALFSLAGERIAEDYSLYNGVFLYLLIQTGTGQISIVGKKYALQPCTLVVLAPEYPGYLSGLSDNFSGKLLVVTKSFLDTLPAADKMYGHITQVMLQQHQVNLLNREQNLVLFESISTIRTKLHLTNHHLKSEMIQNALVNFLLELSNIWIENHWDLLREPHQIRYEYVLKSFFNSLMQHYRQEHSVPFYAAQIHITPQYLSLIIKSLTGRTPSQFIFERLYCEARTLLDSPDLSIKEISDRLHFSDQSAFGKFFKKRSGISPVDYRKGVQLKVTIKA